MDYLEFHLALHNVKAKPFLLDSNSAPYIIRKHINNQICVTNQETLCIFSFFVVNHLNLQIHPWELIMVKYALVIL